MRTLAPLPRRYHYHRHHQQAKNLHQRKLLFERLEDRRLLTSIPVALADPLYATPLNTDLTISSAASGVLNNDFDADGNSLTASVVVNPADVR